MADVDLHALLRDLSRTMLAVRDATEAARAGADVDPHAPFARARWVSTRETMELLRERASAGDPAAGRLAAWVHARMILRVNAGAEHAARVARRAETIPVEALGARLSVHDLVGRILSRDPATDALRVALEQGAGDAHAAARTAWARRGEIARRLGEPDPRKPFEVLASSDDATAVAASLLAGTDEPASAALPRRATWVTALGVLSAHDAAVPMPARLGFRWVIERFEGEAGWLDVPALRSGPTPELRSFSSFARAFARFGARWADAASSTTLPLPLAHAPSGLQRFTFGALVAGLLGNQVFLRRALGLTEAEAGRARRAFATVALFAVRLAAARVLVQPAAFVEDRRGLGWGWEAHVSRAVAAHVPEQLALVLPQLGLRDEARLVGALEAARLSRWLVDRHDEDWYRNPRALIDLKDRLGRAPELVVSRADADAGVTALAAALSERLA